MKKILLVILATLIVIGLTACGEEKTSGEVEIKTNDNIKEVIVDAEVNGKYFNEPTRHGLVFKEGSNGEKAVLRGLDNYTSFYDALIEIGAEPGNNVKMENMEADMDHGVAVDGEKLDVTVKWDGQEEIPFSEILRSNGSTELDVRFGGNLEAAKEYNTGCILCLDSCAVGITSNANYKTGSTQNGEVEFYGKEKVLPADGTKVQVIFRLHEDK